MLNKINIYFTIIFRSLNVFIRIEVHNLENIFPYVNYWKI